VAAVGLGEPPRGAYLGVREHPQLTPVSLVRALADPSRRVAVAGRTGGMDPLERAVRLGTGTSGRRDDAPAAPAGLQLADDPRIGLRSLALALHVADAISAADIAGGRRILALGDLDGDGALRCPSGADRTIAAGDERIDVVVAPPGCAASRHAPRHVDATSLEEAVLALLGGT
jgi:hypothetical protein